MNRKTLVYLSLITLVASLSPAAHAQTFSVIHSFDGLSGALPYAGVTIRDGILYGTTPCVNWCVGSDEYGTGTVYQIRRVGSSWVHSPISFLPAGGIDPEARVVFGPDDHLYSTTEGHPPFGIGLVFSLTPPVTQLAKPAKTTNGFWTEDVLHQFTGSPDGASPGWGDLVWDAMGNIYGTTYGGGSSSMGTVFQMEKLGNAWTEAPIYSFTGADGAFPIASVILDGRNNLFGTTAAGGLHGVGAVFELTYNGVGWTDTVLYSFQNLADGESPYAGLVRDNAGNLYGATIEGGSGGGGTVFELSPAGDTWAFTLLYSFSGESDCGPRATLTLDNSGNLYGTTLCDGTGHGNVFKLTNTQNGWEYTSLHDFTYGTDGGEPFSNVTLDSEGNLYGTANAAGLPSNYCPVGCGTVWMIKP